MIVQILENRIAAIGFRVSEELEKMKERADQIDRRLEAYDEFLNAFSGGRKLVREMREKEKDEKEASIGMRRRVKDETIGD